MSRLPRIETARLTLRPSAHEDLDALAAIWRDPQVRRYLFDGLEVSSEEAGVILADAIAPHSDGLGLWTIEQSTETIGCVGLLPVGAVAQLAPELFGGVEALIALAPQTWRASLATEALRAAVDYGFGMLGLTRIVAANDVPNEASERLLRRVGFEILGEVEGPTGRLRTYALNRL